MLGVIIGAITAISILVFFQRDPKAVQQRREEQKKIKEEQEEQVKKAQEEREKIMNDPANVQKRDEAKKAMKEKMLSGLSESERKLIGDYFNEKKNEGKSDEQIMKEASVQAFAFVCILLFITMLAAALIFIMWTGKEEEVVNSVSQLIESVRELINWVFPRFASSGVPGTPQAEL